MRVRGHLAALLLTGFLTGLPAFAAPEPGGATAMDPEATTPDPNTPADGPTVAPAPTAVAPVAVPPAPVKLDAIGERIKAELSSEPARLSSAEREDRAALAKFYAARSYASIWLDDEKLSKRARMAKAEIERADDWGLKSSAFDLPEAQTAAAGSDELKRQLVNAEIKLDIAILKYARHARGGRFEPGSLSANLDRKLVLFEPKGVIEGIAGSEATDKYLQSLHPQHPQFERLRQKYLAARSGTLAQDADASNEQKSDRSRKKGGSTASAKPSQGALARRLLANMEEWRWMPTDLGQLYVMDNIPEYMTRVVKNGKVIFTERIVVGQTDKQTPVFSQPMEFIVFHPEWGVPDGIKVKEILPSLRRSSGGGGLFGLGGGEEPAVLRQHGLKVSYRGRYIDASTVDWSSANINNYQFSQPPGAKNVLGVVKFRFPNKHDVYMHDTPTKGLFNASVRTFSHGCMRVQNPVRLAEILLHEDRGWGPEKVASLVNGGPSNNSITLNRKIPVHVTYFTAWVDDDGKLRTYGDPYGHEERISAALEGRTPQVVAASARPAADSEDGTPRQRQGGKRSRVAQTSKSSGPQNWLQGLFGN